VLDAEGAGPGECNLDRHRSSWSIRCPTDVSSAGAG
jgi:hypothetical protein